MNEKALKESSGDDSGETSVVIQVREFARAQLDKGAKAADLSFALTYVATEMGLVISTDPVRVFPVLLRAISHAAAFHLTAKAESIDDSEAPEMPTDESIPAGTIVH